MATCKTYAQNYPDDHAARAFPQGCRLGFAEKHRSGEPREPRKEQEVGGTAGLSLSIFADDFHCTKWFTAAPCALTQSIACDR